MNNFLRQVEILIGPLTEGSNGNPAQAMRLFSDGSRNGLRIAFHVQKSIMSTPNFSTISIWNLNEDTRALLNNRNFQITVNAGWSNSAKLPLIFSGGILSSFSERQGPDIVTRINALTMGDTLSKSILSLKYKSGTYIATCLLNIMSQVNGVKYDLAKVNISKDKVGTGGISFAGQAKDLLDMMGRQYGFTWSIQDGIFQAVGDNSILSGDPVVLDGNNGTLINVLPILTGMLQLPKGVRIRASMQPFLTTGKLVTVVNSANSGLDNDYKIWQIDYQGDTFGNDWFIDIISIFNDEI